MKKIFLSLAALSVLVSFSALAEPTYNVTIGSTFEIKISDLPENSGITQFDQKPDVYVTGGALGSKKKKAKVLTPTKTFPPLLSS